MLSHFHAVVDIDLDFLKALNEINRAAAFVLGWACCAVFISVMSKIHSGERIRLLKALEKRAEKADENLAKLVNVVYHKLELLDTKPRPSKEKSKGRKPQK